MLKNNENLNDSIYSYDFYGHDILLKFTNAYIANQLLVHCQALKVKKIGCNSKYIQLVLDCTQDAKLAFMDVLQKLLPGHGVERLQGQKLEGFSLMRIHIKREKFLESIFFELFTAVLFITDSYFSEREHAIVNLKTLFAKISVQAFDQKEAVDTSKALNSYWEIWTCHDSVVQEILSISEEPNRLEHDQVLKDLKLKAIASYSELFPLNRTVAEKLKDELNAWEKRCASENKPTKTVFFENNKSFGKRKISERSPDDISSQPLIKNEPSID